MRLNTAVVSGTAVGTTHEGARAARISKWQELRRSVLACMLWEDTFYESGEDIAQRIASLVQEVQPQEVAQLAVEARGRFKLRHVPLLLAVMLAKRNERNGELSALVQNTTAAIIQRPDELAEILAIYAKQNGRTEAKKLNKLSHALARGIAQAFVKFDEYRLAKYNRDNEIKLRDVLFLTRPRSTNRTVKSLWRRLAKNELKTPDTWEVAISATKNETQKTEEWTRLLREQKLGALALLRNLRNMTEAKVDKQVIREALVNMKTERVLPFRFIAAARYAPQFEDVLEQAMFKCLEDYPRLPGKTIIVIDDSGSMDAQLSAKSDLKRKDAAAALAILVREVCEQAAVIVFATNAKVVAPRRGFALKEVIQQANVGGSTQTGAAVQLANWERYDRIIVLTDEQSHTSIPAPLNERAYFINVAPYKRGIGYGAWTHIDGFSESVLDYICEYEAESRNSYNS